MRLDQVTFIMASALASSVANAAPEFHGVWSSKSGDTGATLGLYQFESKVCGYWATGNRVRVHEGYLFGTVKNGRLSFRQCEASGHSSGRQEDCPSMDSQKQMVWLNGSKLGHYMHSPVSGWGYNGTFERASVKPVEPAFTPELRAFCKLRSNISVEVDALEAARPTPKR